MNRIVKVEVVEDSIIIVIVESYSCMLFNLGYVSCVIKLLKLESIILKM